MFNVTGLLFLRAVSVVFADLVSDAFKQEKVHHTVSTRKELEQEGG